MIILGIDPGTSKDNFGWGIITEGTKKKKYEYVDSGIYRLSPKLSFAYKLLSIAEHVSSLIEDYKVNMMSVESFFAFGRTKGASRIHELRGVLEYLSAYYGIPFIDVAPKTVKLLTCGDGNGSKKKVATAVTKKLGVDLKSKTSHETDALAIALCATTVQLRKKNG